MSVDEEARIREILRTSHEQDEAFLETHRGTRQSLSRQRLASKRWERRLDAVESIRRSLAAEALRAPLPEDLIPVVLTRRDIEAIIAEPIEIYVGHRARLDLACWDALDEDARLRASDPEGSGDE